GAEHADTLTPAARHLRDRDVDHAEHRAAGGAPELVEPDVGGVTRHDQEIHEPAEPRGGVDELRGDPPRLQRAAIAASDDGKAAMIPDHHGRVAAIPVLGNQALRAAVDTNLEVHRRLRAHAAKDADPFHGLLLTGDGYR